MPQSLGWLDIVQRRWFQTLISGLVLFYVVQWVLIGTQNLNFMPTLLLLGAFLTPVAFVTYVYERQPIRNVPLATVAICFFWGGAVGAVVAGLLEYETLRRLNVLSLFEVAVIEEAAKLIFPAAIFLRGRYRLESEGLLFGVAAGMGFAALETMGYGFVALLSSRGDLGALDATLLARGLLAPAGHAAWTGLVCAVAWRERERAGHPVLNGAVVGAFAAAVLLHGLWDSFNFLAAASGRFPLIALVAQLLSLAVALASLGLLIRRLREARREDGAPGAISDQGADLYAAVQQAQANLTAAEANLLQVLAGPRWENVVMADASEVSALAKLAGMEVSRPEQIEAAEAALAAAQAKLAVMQAGSRPENIGNAQAAVDSALAKLVQLVGPPLESDLVAAQTAVETARQRDERAGTTERRDDRVPGAARVSSERRADRGVHPAECPDQAG